MHVGSLPRTSDPFATAFEHAAIGMALVSLAGRFTKVNPALCRLVGYSEEELLQRTFQELTHAPDLDVDLQHAQRLLHGEIPSYQLEKRYIHKDGSLVWIHLTGTLVRAPDSEPDHFIAQIQDITGRKRAEAQREQALAELADLYDEAPVGYHSLDAEGRFVRVNRTEARWLGYAREELLGRRFADLLTRASQARFEKTFPEFRRTGSVRDLEFELIRKDGTLMPVLLSATAVLDDRGEFLASRSTTYDLTERRRAESAGRESLVARALVRRILSALTSDEATSALRRRDVGRALAREVPASALLDHLRQYVAMGLGHVDLAVEQDGRYTFTGADLLDRAAACGSPTCHVTLGCLEGAVSRATGTATLGTEVRCQSQGHPACVFVVHTR